MFNRCSNYIFSKYIIQFGNENSYLWRILNNTFQANSQIQINEAKKILSDIDNEISYLNQAPNCENEIWNQKLYVQILTKVRNSINEIIIQDPSPIRISFNNIITRLQEIRYPNNQYIILRDQIIEKIAKDSENNPTKEQLIIDQEQAKKFIDIINIFKSNMDDVGSTSTSKHCFFCEESLIFILIRKIKLTCKFSMSNSISK